MPAAVSRWPMFAFTAPIAQRARSPARTAAAYARFSPLNSIGSPSAVPVPCASSRPSVAGSIPARAHASTSSSACATGLGTVRDCTRPPWFSALPRITPWMRSPSRRARESGFSTITPTPSPRT